MELDSRFKVNQPEVVHETFGDEVVVINLDSGSYYSLNKVALDIWGLVAKGFPLGAVIDKICRSYSCNGSDVKASVSRFVVELEQEQLIMKNHDTAETEPDTEPPSASKKAVFEDPVISKYTDMQELLLLDPIHDVDETGWPNACQPL